ncbi:MAG TPA: L,D-transpeptidase [Candidatus Dormibacteraeota bacterium]|nr:L,D-transpeptidase [Candidatus Dormibacteraeota bacterium]
MSVIGSTLSALRSHRPPAWLSRRSVLVVLATAAIASVSLAASAVSDRGRSGPSSAAISQQQIDDRQIKAAASALLARYKVDPQALRTLGANALSSGRNDATVAAFLRLRWIGRMDPQLERYGAQLDAGGPTQLALAAAGTQYYSELIHKALLQLGPQRLVVVSLQAQRLLAYDHRQVLVDTMVTTGRSALPTDVGAMHVWKKDSPWTMKSPWPKGSPDWYPDTKVQMVVWFTTTGEGLHDASWQPAGTFGPGSQNGPYASHGCIHLPAASETSLFNWVAIGTPVVVIPGDGSPLAAQLAQQSVDAMGNPIAGVRGD